MATLLLDISTVRALGGIAQWVRKADFVIVLTGASILDQNAPSQLYDERAQTTAQASVLQAGGLRGTALLPYDHPPMEAMLVSGLQSLGWSAEACFALWTLVSLIAIAVSLIILTSEWTRKSSGLLTSLAAISFYPLSTGILLGQSTALVLLGWSSCTVLLRRGHDGWAGAALALAALKPQTVPVLLLALVIGRRYRALAGFAGVAAASVLATLPALGWQWPIRYLAFLARYAQAPVGPGNPAINQGWVGLFQKLLGDGMPSRWATASAIALSLLLVAWTWRRFQPGGRLDKERQLGWDLRWAFTLIVAVLADPHVLPHDLALAIVPAVILAASPDAWRRKASAWLWLGWLIGFAAVLYRGQFPPIATLWLAASAGWLFWALQRERCQGSSPWRQILPIGQARCD